MPFGRSDPSQTYSSRICWRATFYEEDLVDQLFKSSEKRLARVLLLLAHFGKDEKPEPVIPKISQESQPKCSALREEPAMTGPSHLSQGYAEM